MTAPPRRRSLGRRLAFALGASLVLLVGAELAVRAVGEVLRRTTMTPEVRAYVESNRVVFDPQLGWRPATLPAEVDTMSLGLGRPDLPVEPPPGRVRVFTFGDSQTQGGGVNPDQAWPAAAERSLRARGLDVEVVNAGAPGYRSAQVLQLVQARVLAWSPDVLVVDCMRLDSPALPDAPAVSSASPVAAVLFESRLYRLLWLGLARARGENVGVLDTSRIEQPRSPQASEGAGNHAAIQALGRAAGVDVVFVDYPSRPSWEGRIEPGITAADLPPDAVLVHATDALLASGRHPNELYFDVNHLRPPGNDLVGAAVADVLAPIVARRGAATLPEGERDQPAYAPLPPRNLP